MTTRRVRASNPVPMIIIALLVLAAIGGGGYWYYTQQQAQVQAALAANASATSAAQQATSDAVEAANASATALAQATVTAGEAAIERQYQAAVAFQAAADYAQARTAFSELISAQPGYKDTADRLKQVSEALAEAYYQQGLAAAKERVWGDAVSNFDLALGVIPNYKDAAAQRAAATRELNVTPTPRPSPTVAPSATPDPATAATSQPETEQAGAAPTGEPANDTAFRDTFDVKMSDKWQVVVPGLSVVNGQLSGRDGLVLYKPAHNNYVVTVEVRGSIFSIPFRTTMRGNSWNEGYSFYCEYSNCRWRIIQNGYTNNLSSGYTSDIMADGKPHTLRLEIRGEEFIAYVDGEPFMSIRDKTFSSGSIGLWVRDLTAFNSFEVTYP